MQIHTNLRLELVKLLGQKRGFRRSADYHGLKVMYVDGTYRNYGADSQTRLACYQCEGFDLLFSISRSISSRDCDSGSVSEESEGTPIS